MGKCFSQKDNFFLQYYKCFNLIKEVESTKNSILGKEDKQSEGFKDKLTSLTNMQKTLRMVEIPKLESILSDHKKTQNNDKKIEEKEGKYKLILDAFNKVCDNDSGMPIDALKGVTNVI